MNHNIMSVVVACVMALSAVFAFDASATVNRKERRTVSQGNELFRGGHYLEAAEKYQQALKIEPSSKEALYNLGLTYIRRAQTAQSDSLRAQLSKAGVDAMQAVAQLIDDKPELAADALFNLGNIAFHAEDYAGAVNMYKQSLRVRPEDDKTRRNLRIAQKKLKDNQDDQNKDQNKDQEKDQNQEKEQEQNKDQQQQEQQEQNQQQPKEQEINPQTAQQILQAMENKENQTRARVNKSNNGENAAGRSKNNKRW